MKNVYEFFENSCLEYPLRPYVFDKRMWTYKETFKYINIAINFLTSKKIKLNDKVVIYMENSIDYIVLYFAILYKGATVIPVAATSTLENIINIIEDSQPQLVLTSSMLFQKISQLDISSKYIIALFEISSVKVDECDDIPLMQTGHLAMIIYTSGTTNKPKGVMLSHGNLIANTISILDYLKLCEADSILAILSFAYSYGNSILLTHTKVGAMLYLYKAIYPQNVLKRLETGKYTGFSTVGSYLNILLKQDNFTNRSFRHVNYITLAGEETAKSNLTRLQATNDDLRIFVMYGQTEASARLTYLEPEMLNKKLGSIGKPVKNVNAKIVNENGEEVQNGCEGEIWVKGENIMQGYLNNPEETSKVLRNGWLITGDIGYKDKDGYLYITGRKKDIIKYLGYRISPTEIENYINLYEDILESGVTEVELDDYNNIIAAIVLKPTVPQFDVKLLCQELRKKLPVYKIPKYFFVVEEIPKTTNGKIRRKEIKEKFLHTKREDIRTNDF